MPEPTPPSAPIRWHRDADDIITLTLDAPGRSANTLDTAFRAALTAAADRLEAERDTVTGVVITSAKRTFCAGGDLNDFRSAGPADARHLFDLSMGIKRDLRRIETLGRPVVAALNGTALGGGLEIALACHHRVALDRPDIRFGLPEVTLGLLPGGGGVTRAVRLLGITDALDKVLLHGARYAPAEARAVGLVHELVPTERELLAAARDFITTSADARQPWDVPGHRIPGGTPADPAFAAVLPTLTPALIRRAGGAPTPAQRAILATAVEGAQVGFDTAGTIEARYFTEVATGQTAKNMIQAFFYDLQAVTAGRGRPGGIPRRPLGRIAVLGTGPAAAFARCCAEAGLDTAPGADATDRDIVVGEPAGLAAAERDAAPDALLCAAAFGPAPAALPEDVQRQEDLLGLGLALPVGTMPLVEIVRGPKTGDAALARAFDLVRRLRRTPIVVNDPRGTATARVAGNLVKEGIALLGEGVPPASVEQAAARAGFRATPLALADELTLTLITELAEAGLIAPDHPADRVLARMLGELDRPGRAAGFYTRPAGAGSGARPRLWPGLREHFAPRPGAPDLPFQDIQERLLFAEALTTVRLLDEGVLTSVTAANIGSLLGTGFPAWTGGALQYINGYRGGPAGFAARAAELAARYGTRFKVPAALAERAARGEMFAD
ncbi:enoyl-CoA hydratase-related protein [Streptomyces litchfieldiae]|uniref:Enoyl-CoA hydratase-related protein n=1 Tax=Streptomyces litchfieldiae TaxID=3075543 RepID=A0ABU2MW10_9ACTN|nr:enoyl-CoA hydratase-related protein [Streptomyces sp. DSM 44938]MDT0345828.1 enoyl-CoA hydratase-related protein [Streptomyces sp. DSM 44938]